MDKIIKLNEKINFTLYKFIFIPKINIRDYRKRIIFSGINILNFPIIHYFDYQFLLILNSFIFLYNLIEIKSNKYLTEKVITKIDFNDNNVVLYTPKINLIGNMNLFGNSFLLKKDSIKIRDFKHNLVIFFDFQDVNNEIYNNFYLTFIEDNTLLKDKEIFFDLFKNELDIENLKLNNKDNFL